MVFSYVLSHATIIWPENIVNKLQVEPAVSQLKKDLAPYEVALPDELDGELAPWLSGDRLKDVEKLKASGKFKSAQPSAFPPKPPPAQDPPGQQSSGPGPDKPPAAPSAPAAGVPAPETSKKRAGGLSDRVAKKRAGV